MSESPKIAIITNVIPQYREDMYLRLIREYGDSLHIYCQSHIKGMNLNTVHKNLGANVTVIKALSLKKEKLSWQFVPILKIIRGYDIVFIYGNPRVLSNVFWSLILKILGRKLVVWGQYHTAGSSLRMKKIRIWWWNFFDFVFLYTDKEAEQYKSLYPVHYVTGMNNGLNQKEIKSAIKKYPQECLNKWSVKNGLNGKVILLSCARLDKKNNFNIVIECLPEIIKKHPNVMWCVIGDGDEISFLKIKADELGVAKYITWLGAMYDQEDLAPWFLYARCLIHPGAIGLSLIHAMNYGLPVVTHDNESNQMPEIAALQDGFNGVLFKEGDCASFISKVLYLIENDDYFNDLSIEAKKTVAENYNTKTMANKFIGMINKIEEEM